MTGVIAATKALVMLDVRPVIERLVGILKHCCIACGLVILYPLLKSMRAFGDV
jgi:hypothetical protein